MAKWSTQLRDTTIARIAYAAEREYIHTVTGGEEPAWDNLAMNRRNEYLQGVYKVRVERWIGGANTPQRLFTTIVRSLLAEEETASNDEG